MFESTPVVESVSKKDRFFGGVEAVLSEAVSRSAIDIEQERALLAMANDMANDIRPSDDPDEWVKRFAQANLTVSGHTDDELE